MNNDNLSPNLQKAVEAYAELSLEEVYQFNKFIQQDIEDIEEKKLFNTFEELFIAYMNQDFDDKNMIKVIDSLRADIKNKFSIKKLHDFEEKMRSQYGFNDIQKKIYAIYDAQMHRFLNKESWELTQDEARELAMYRKKLKSLN